MSTAKPTASAAATEQKPSAPRELRIYGHSILFYWWPVWAAGYVLALMTWWSDDGMVIMHKDKVEVVPADQGAFEVKIKPDQRVLQSSDKLERVLKSKNPGVLFSVILWIVILITSVPLRGLRWAIVFVSLLLFAVLFAWLEWWDIIFDWLGRVSIHMNMGFYVFFSTALFLVWSLVFFGYDRMSYWRVTPGQITHEFVFGGGQTSYDTEGMVFEKLRDDLFRHWVLGLGSGDLIMHPLRSVSGSGEELEVHNVLFVGSKLAKIQQLISQQEGSR